ncbi:TPA: hypothetical protein HGR29_21565 [Escherichia coli]|nr:hypothetical protein [Escherichia coli O21:H34]HAG7734978.1 hypothetical protein [Escherichia coli]
MNGEQHTDSLLKICETIEKRLKIFCILIASQALMIEGKNHHYLINLTLISLNEKTVKIN